MISYQTIPCFKTLMKEAFEKNVEKGENPGNIFTMFCAKYRSRELQDSMDRCTHAAAIWLNSMQSIKYVLLYYFQDLLSVVWTTFDNIIHGRQMIFCSPHLRSFVQLLFGNRVSPGKYGRFLHSSLRLSTILRTWKPWPIKACISRLSSLAFSLYCLVYYVQNTAKMQVKVASSNLGKYGHMRWNTDTGWKITETFPQGGKIARYKLCLRFPIMFLIELDLYCRNLVKQWFACNL